MISKKHIFPILLFLLFVQGIVGAQSFNNELLSIKNRKIFGEHLFCERDYLRAINEFDAVLKHKWNDTLQFKIGLSNFFMSRYSKAKENYKMLFRSPLSVEAKLEFYRNKFSQGDYFSFRELYKSKKYLPLNYSFSLNKLKTYSYLMDDSLLPNKDEFLLNFEKSETERIKTFYEWKEDPPYKNPTKGAILSAIIPGLGKVYADEIGDGITSFLLTGLFTYLAIDKFQKDQTMSAWLFTGFAAFFYSGNIYGSAAAVQNYNASIKFNFDNEVKLYLNERNHFLPKPKYMCE